jgi:hypothetical protein
MSGKTSGDRGSNQHVPKGVSHARAGAGPGGQLDEVMRSAARLQRLVPDAVLVGGTAAAWHARHRVSLDHDHVLADLRERFDTVLDAITSADGYAHTRHAPGKIILGSLDGVQMGVRQLIRARPLETEVAVLPSGETVNVPTVDETQRIKAFLVVDRNQTRDYLDLAALADHTGVGAAAANLAQIDRYYQPRRPRTSGTPVLDDLVLALADPRPLDSRAAANLAAYKGLRPRWREWGAVVEVCRDLAEALAESKGGEQ